MMDTRKMTNLLLVVVVLLLAIVAVRADVIAPAQAGSKDQAVLLGCYKPGGTDDSNEASCVDLRIAVDVEGRLIIAPDK